MRKLVRSLALFSAFAVAAAHTGTLAQDKKPDPKKPPEVKKDDKKPEPKKSDDKTADETKKADDKPVIELYKNDKGRWRFRVKDAAGKVVAMPHATLNWETKTDAEKAIADLKTILTTVKPTEVKD